MRANKENLNLSKSKFVAGIQCLKRLYLQCYNPRPEDDIDEATKAMFKQGHEVGSMAQKAFSGGILVNFDQMPFDVAASITRDLIKDRYVPAIYEAAFSFDNINVRVDILKRMPGNRWQLVEVKSTSGLKDHYLVDVAIQKYVLENCGLKVSKTCLMHLNRDYVYDGKSYELRKLFTQEDLSNKLRSITKEIPKFLREQWKALACKQPPEIEPGDQCEDPYTCEFYDECNEEKPLDWIGHLPRLNKNKMQELANLGITSVHDIPDDFKLSETQKRACRCVCQGNPCFGTGLKRDLGKLTYPLYFIDFETINPAIPRYAGLRPFDTIPFQWSVHVQKAPKSEVEHYEFLFEDKADPRKAFIEALLPVLERGDKTGRAGTGNIVVFNKNFESQRLSDIARWLPEYSKKINRVQKRLWDLQAVMRDHVYHPEFYGSFSLKTVLPALIPHMTYEGMPVAEGGTAGVAYEKLLSGELKKSEYQNLRKALLNYCKQDTLAMVKLLERLQRECGKA